jgi:hypothetical protein
MRCFWVVDVGTQTYKTTSGRKLWLSFELPETSHKFKPDEPEQPFSVSTSFFWGFGPKSQLRKFVEAWRGKPYTEEEAKEKGFDPAKFVGVGAEGMIVHNGEYANIQTIMPLRKQSDCPPAINKAVYVSLEPEEFDMRSFDRLPKFLREMIEKSPEWEVLVELGCTDGNFDAEDYLAKKGSGDFEKEVEKNKAEWKEAEEKHLADIKKNVKELKDKEPVIEDDDIPF